MNQLKKQKILHYLYRLKSFGYKYQKTINFSQFSNNEVDGKTLDMLEHCKLCAACNLTDKKNIDYGDTESKLILISTLVIKEPQELDLMKKMINNVLFLNFESIYMLNIVKCDLSKKDVTNEFINECLPYINKQMKSCNSNANYIFIGESYKHILMNNEEILYGTIIDFLNQKALILPELDFILKNPSSKNTVFDGLKRLKVFMEQ